MISSYPCWYHFTQNWFKIVHLWYYLISFWNAKTHSTNIHDIDIDIQRYSVRRHYIFVLANRKYVVTPADIVSERFWKYSLLKNQRCIDIILSRVTTYTLNPGCCTIFHDTKSRSPRQQEDDGTHFCCNKEFHFSAAIQLSCMISISIAITQLFKANIHVALAKVKISYFVATLTWTK